MPGIDETIACLKKAGLKTALISAGVSVLADRLEKNLALDHVFANRLLTDRQGFLTGEATEVVCLLDKLKTLNKLRTAINVLPDEIAVVGDSIYDVPMFEEAGLSIAFNASSDAVKKAADVAIDKKDLREILPYLTTHSE
jgi:phosphoserine phosphatase